MTGPGVPVAMAPFPTPRPGHLEAPAALAGRGFRLRPLVAADIPWIRDLYATTREEEMAQVPWPPQLKRNFLDQQCALQHAHYLAHFGDTDFMALVHNGRPAGRLYLQRGGGDSQRDADLVVDISVFPRHRGQGLGEALLRAAQEAAVAGGRGVWLHVQRHNARARRLYERLGFVADDHGESHIPMYWRAPVAP